MFLFIFFFKLIRLVADYRQLTITDTIHRVIIACKKLGIKEKNKIK
jgi:hypothetical protein